MGSDVDLTKVQTLLTQVIGDGRDLSAQLERGQVETPLVDRFLRMAETLTFSKFTGGLLGFSRGSAVTVIDWISGRRFEPNPLLYVPDSIGLVIIRLGGNSFAVEEPGGEWLELDSLELLQPALLEIVAQDSKGENLLRSGPLNLRLPSSDQSAENTFVIVTSPELVISSPALTLSLTSATNFFVVAGDREYVLSERDRSLLRDIMRGADVMWPFCTGDSEASDDLQGWWNDGEFPKMAHVLPVHFLAATKAPQVPPLFTNRADRLRLALIIRHLARKVILTSQALVDRCVRESQQLEKRRSILEARIKALEKQARDLDVRTMVETLKMKLEDSVSRVSDELDQRNRMAFSPSGPVLSTVMAYIRDLETLDEGETTPKATRLEVPRDFILGLKKRIEQQLYSRLHEDSEFVRLSLRDLEWEINERLSEWTGRPTYLEVPSLDEKQIAAIMGAMIEVEIKSRGEIPKMGIFKILSGGRQKAFMVIITLNLVMGSILAKGTNIRSALGAGILVLFIAGIVGSIWAAKKDKQELIVKELDRVKDALTSEVRRLISEAQREKLARLSGYVSEAKKRTQRRVEETLKDMVGARLQSSEEDKKVLNTTYQGLAGRVKLLEDYGKRAAGAEKSGMELDAMCAIALGNAIKLLVIKEAVEEVAPSAEQAPAEAGLPNPWLPRAEGASDEQPTGQEQKTDQPQEEKKTEGESRKTLTERRTIGRSLSMAERLKAISKDK